jgi:peptidoglycan/xylan/chitin deacetylase (PgdA/CDA1 family)
MHGGALVISLDFELYWGVRDVLTLDSYRSNLLGVRQAIPALLDAFAQHAVHATWATVGFLFCRNKKEIEQALPSRRPDYVQHQLSPYDLSVVGNDEASDPFHYAPSLIEQIARAPGQEIATHTFSHFYCLEKGQTAQDFDADLTSAVSVARPFGVELKSIVFPRNQQNRAYDDVLTRHGIRAYRSCGRWPYTASVGAETWLKRGTRLADAYIPISGDGTVTHTRDATSGLVDLPASAFLRPYSFRLRSVERLKVARIMRAMSRAARRSRVFHLWWHPHNFGTNLRQNMAMLAVVLEHFDTLRRTRGMRTLTMAEAAATLAG